MIKLLLAILLAATSVSAAPVQGRIDQTTDLRIVHVWGTPAEMGYAHGWLVGDDFVLGMKELFAGLPPAMHGLLNMVRSWTVWIALSDAHRAELDGIYRGMRDRLGEDAMQLPGVERPLDQTDLLLWNGYDMFRSVGCSGFTAWGDRTTDGKTITARTLDLAVFSPHWVRTQILLVRHPNTGVATASVTPVCLLGTMTGINANGVCAFLHDGDGDEMTAVTEPERPLMLALLDILQQATGSTAQQVAARELAAQGPFPYSYFIRIVGPQIGDAPPATTYRLDANGVSKATGGEQFSIVTNHSTEQGDEPPRMRPGDSYRRYARLHKACIDPQTRIDANAAWAALREVAPDHQSFMALHAVVVRPEAGELQVCIAGVNEDGRLETATKRPITTLSLAQLFVHPKSAETVAEATSPLATPVARLDHR